MIEISKDFPWRAGMLVKWCDSGVFGITPAWRITEIVQPPEKDEDGDTVFAIGANVVDVHDACLLVNIDAPDFPDQPDLNDGATVGALAETVREAFGLPDLETYRGDGGYFIADFAPENEPEPYSDWPTLRADGTFGVNNKAEVSGVTRGEAWLAAWNARPVKA